MPDTSGILRRDKKSSSLTGNGPLPGIVEAIHILGIRPVEERPIIGVGGRGGVQRDVVVIDSRPSGRGLHKCDLLRLARVDEVRVHPIKVIIV